MNKWKLHHGIHRGTIISRDEECREFDTEAEARTSYRENKKFYAGIGYHIWFAYLYTPDGERITLDAGIPYER